MKNGNWFCLVYCLFMGWTFGYDMIIQLLDEDFNADITVVVEKVGAGVIYV